MSAKRTKPSSKPVESARRGRAHLAKLRVVRDRDIARTSPSDLADLPADFWAEAELVLPVPKQAISLRVDEDVLSWFRNLGPRYQTRMNAVLRLYMSQASRSRSSVHRSRSGAA